MGSQSAAEIVTEIMGLDPGTRFLLLAPVVKHRKGEFRDLFKEALGQGFARARVDGEVIALEDPPTLKKDFKHDIELVIDRLVMKDGLELRLTDSVETALKQGDGEVIVAIPDGEERLLSEKRSCCGVAYPELEPTLFSFNTPRGMCVECNGLGYSKVMDPSRVVADDRLSLNDGAIVPWASALKRQSGWTWRFIHQACLAFDVDQDTPWGELSEQQRELLLWGTQQEFTVRWQGKRSSGQWKSSFEGVIPSLARKHKQTESSTMRRYYEGFMRDMECPACGGARLRPESRSVFVGEHTLPALTDLSVGEAHEIIETLQLTGARAEIAHELKKEIGNRLRFLVNVGLEYLNLARSGPTLSGGESQRIRLAAQVGTELTGVIYILDEPSIGLHQRDNRRLLGTLEHLRDIGNSVVVVEHDEETIRAADYVVDFGPGAGRLGGEIVFAGTPAALEADEGSLTGAYLSGRRQIPFPEVPRQPGERWLELLGCTHNNLRDIDLRIPTGCMVAITGVSGAGKSSLLNGTLSPALANHYHDARRAVGPHRELLGLEHFDKVIDIDQKPIGRTPRSNPATYTKLFDLIRDVFAQTKESRTLGYEKGRFSFNVKGGRCEACKGDGQIKIEMHFLADVYVPCEVCHAQRFNEATLRVRHRGLNIVEVLDLSCDEALEHFQANPKIRRILQTLVDVGLGYIKLGQSSTTLSGGEAQRIKLSRELAKRATGGTLYLLDEPTTGLHFDDVARLLAVLDRLVDNGNTVVVIEHNLDVIRAADWIIDVGPEGGSGGGEIVVQGPPSVVAAHGDSHTGRFLRDLGH